MRWLVHTARPHARAVVLTKRAISSISTVLLSPASGAFTVPKVAMELEQEWCWPAAAAVDIAGVWCLRNGGDYMAMVGYTHGNLVQDAWSYADELRNAYASESVAGWGLVTRGGIVAGDVLRLGTANPFQYAFKLSDGMSDLALRNSPTHPWSAVSVSYAQFITNGWNLPLANGTGAAWISWTALAGWDGFGIHQVGTNGEGRYLLYPYTWPLASGEINQNYVGASQPGGYAGDPLFAWAHAGPGARVEIADGQALAPPEWMQLVPDGATITGARIQITVGSLERHTVSVTSEVSGGNLVTAGADVEEEEDMGVALLRGVRNGTRYDWDVLAVTPPVAATDGKSVIVDGMAFVQALLADRPSTNHCYAVVPSPAVEGLSNADNKAWLDSLRPDIELAYQDTGTDTQPAAVHQGPAAPFGGGTYVASSVSRYVTWESVTVGWFSIDFTVPDLPGLRSFQGGWPIMGSPPLG